MGALLLYLFYGATLAALGFFIHKVLWLVHYKRIQRSIVDEAVRKLRQGNVADEDEWEEFARSCWSNALGQAEVSGPSTFIRRVEEGLGRIRGDLQSSRRSIEDLLADSLANKDRASSADLAAASPSPSPSPEEGDARPAAQGSSNRTMLARQSNRPAAEVTPRRVEVLALRRLTKRGGDERYHVSVDVAFPPVTLPRPPDKRLYELTVRSRYGLVRRALVFFSGVADVVYSSHHVALMSQNLHVPTSVLVRRLSLVFLVLAVVLVDMTFSVRDHITQLLNVWIEGKGPGFRAGPAPSTLLGTVLGFAVWAAIYGSIYLALFFAIRRRYQVNVRRLREMRAEETRAMKALYRRHVGELVRWSREYGRSLDNAVEITVRHAGTLVDHYGHRLRRRIASPAVLEGAKSIADCLFLKLPESRGDLQDAATTHKHSLAHYVWPRVDEMGYQVRHAQYRAAWQHLELAVADLRKEQPDPSQAHALWRTAWVFAKTFSQLVPAGLADELRQAYAQMVIECVAQTDKDLGELDKRLGELHRSLGDQLESARPLVESRVELTNSHVQAAVAALCAEIISVREQARLEAMAFES